MSIDIAAVRAAHPIQDVVAASGVELRPRGHGWLGCCPFHEDNTASLSVAGIPDRFHCFGCGAGGDVIDWTMRTAHVGFADAVSLLEANAVPPHLPAPTTAPHPVALRVEPQRAHQINALAWEHYTRPVAHEHALSWLRTHRGLDLRAAETAHRTPLAGHSGADWTTLSRRLRRADVTDDELLALDLATRTRRGQLIDTLHDRLLVPVRTPAGQIAGFVGRDTSGDPRSPKYRNPTRTSVYDKSTALYAPTPVRHGVTAVVVEGPLDALAIASVNDPNAVSVATCGSAVTSTQVRRLLALSPGRIILALDGDSAGRDATLRWVDRTCREAFTPAEVTSLPAGTDPADLIARAGPAGLHQILGDARPPGHELATLATHNYRDPGAQLITIASSLLEHVPAEDRNRWRRSLVEAANRNGWNPHQTFALALAFGCGPHSPAL